MGVKAIWLNCPFEISLTNPINLRYLCVTSSVTIVKAEHHGKTDNPNGEANKGISQSFGPEVGS
jgi:hypothetical protein